MSDQVIDYLESHRELIIKIDTNTLVDKTIEVWKFIKKDFKQQTGKELINPEVRFDSSNIDYLQANLNWEKNDYVLNMEIVQGMFYCYIYYEDGSKRETLDKWYTLNTTLPDWLIEKLSLFAH